MRKGFIVFVVLILVVVLIYSINGFVATGKIISMEGNVDKNPCDLADDNFPKSLGRSAQSSVSTNNIKGDRTSIADATTKAEKEAMDACNAVKVTEKEAKEFDKEEEKLTEKCEDASNDEWICLMEPVIKLESGDDCEVTCTATKTLKDQFGRDVRVTCNSDSGGFLRSGRVSECKTSEGKEISGDTFYKGTGTATISCEGDDGCYVLILGECKGTKRPKATKPGSMPETEEGSIEWESEGELVSEEEVESESGTWWEELW